MNSVWQYRNLWRCGCMYVCSSNATYACDSYVVIPAAMWYDASCFHIVVAKRLWSTMSRDEECSKYVMFRSFEDEQLLQQRRSSINPGAKKRPYPVRAPWLQCFVMFDDVCLFILIAFCSWFFPTCLYCCVSDALKFILLYLMRFWTVYIELNRRGGDRAHILGFTLFFLLQKQIIKYYK